VVTGDLPIPLTPNFLLWEKQTTYASCDNSIGVAVSFWNTENLQIIEVMLTVWVNNFIVE
jgi:hypothetical protein